MSILNHNFSMVITFWRWFNASNQMVPQKFNHLLFFDSNGIFSTAIYTLYPTRAIIIFTPYRLPFLCFWKFCHYRGKIQKRDILACILYITYLVKHLFVKNFSYLIILIIISSIYICSKKLFYLFT